MAEDEDDDPDNMEALTQTMLQNMARAHARGDASSPEQVDIVFKMSMLKAMTKLAGNASEGGDGPGEYGGVRGVAKTMRSYHLLKKKIRERPLPVIREFITEVERRLGIAPGQPYTLRDLAKKVWWGRFKSLHRCFLIFAQIFEDLDGGRTLAAQAMTVQAMKALQQTVLDEGNWRHSWMLVTLQDPYLRDRFAGSEEEMEVVSAYTKVMDDLTKRTSLSSRGQGGNEYEDEYQDRAAPSAAENKRRVDQSKRDRDKAAAAKAAPP
jgi:hypothetical protein